MKTLQQIFPPFLLLLLLFVQITALFVNYSIYDSRELAILFCWIPIFTIPYLIIKKKFYYKAVLTLFFIGGFLNLCHLLILKGPISASSLFVLSNTNMNEAKDFMELKWTPFLFLIIPYVLLFILAIRATKPIVVYPKSKYIIGIVLIISFVFLSENLLQGRLIRKGIPQTAKALIYFKEGLKSYNALKKRKIENIEVSLKSSAAEPHVFVLIIGESCNRNHLSLYNYSKDTNPKLEKRKDIIVYANVVSAHSNTLSSVLSSLTESNLENKMDIDKSISLIDVFHSLKYKTYWLSNQSPFGIWDNAIYNLAQTADVSDFVNQSGSSSYESTYIPSYDEKLFQPFDAALNDTTKDKFIVVHLMGSHSKYSKRYPPEFNKFNNSSTKKERRINEYDNSILYNDYVVDSLLNRLKGASLEQKKSIYSSIYLSDHGENVYDENNNVGHDYSGSLPKSNVEIPFIVWLSSGYKNLYSGKQQTILSNKDLPFVSDDLFHSILDLNDIECKAYSKQKSVFNADFNSKRPRILEDNMNYDIK